MNSQIFNKMKAKIENEMLYLIPENNKEKVEADKWYKDTEDNYDSNEDFMAWVEEVGGNKDEIENASTNNLNQNKISLEEVKFNFSQKGNCIDELEFEQIDIELKNDIGHLEEEGYFFVIRTSQWSFDSLDEFKSMIEKIQKAIELFKHEK